MAVIIDGNKYYGIEDIRKELTKALKNNKDDCFSEDEKNGFELAEHTIILTLQNLEKDSKDKNDKSNDTLLIEERLEIGDMVRQWDEFIHESIGDREYSKYWWQFLRKFTVPEHEGEQE